MIHLETFVNRLGFRETFRYLKITRKCTVERRLNFYIKGSYREGKSLEN